MSSLSLRAPAHWSRISLREVGQFVNGYGFAQSEWSNTGLPIIRIQNLTDSDKPFNFFNGTVDEKYKVRMGDILISWSASLGVYRWASSDGWVNQHIFKVVIENPNLDCEFFYWAAKHEIDHIAESAHGSTMKHVTRNVFLDASIPLPPIAEQRAIALVLQAMQDAREAKKCELALERERKAAIMERLFTRGTSNAEQQITDVGQLPSNWSLKPLGKVVDVVYGVQAAVAHLTNPSTGIPILTNVNITNDGMLDLGTLRYFPLPDAMRNRALLAAGDVLFNWRSGSQNHVGKTAIFEENGEFTFSSFILRFRPNRELFNRFLFYYLQSIKARGYFAQNRQQSSVNSVFNASVAATIPVPVPALSEQHEIAACLLSCDEKIQALEAEMGIFEELFTSTLEDLMTGELSTTSMAEARLNE